MVWRWAVVVALLAVVGPALLQQRAASSPPPGPLSALELRTLEERARAATVEVSTLGCHGLSIGSGFGVAGRIITNRHLVLGATEAKVQRGATLHRSDVLRVDNDLDVAVVSGIGGPDLELAPRRAAVGAPVVVAGRPDAGQVVVRPSVVHGYDDTGIWGMSGGVMLVDAETAPGWSGGPVLDRKGRVVGVLAAQDRSTGLALAVPVDELRRWLADDAPGAPPSCPPPRPAAGA